MKHRRRSRLAAALLLALPCRSANTGQTTQSLTVQTAAYAEVSVPGGVTLTGPGSLFQPFTGVISGINYRARTSPSGSASITLQATADFSPSGGPSVSAGDLTYTCGSASLGSPCSGAQTVSTTAQAPVVGMGGGVCAGTCAALDPNTAQISLTLIDSPAFKTGAYSVALRFTISAL